jgi:hypothetical protein
MNEYEQKLIEMGVIDTSIVEWCRRKSILGKDYGFIIKDYTSDRIVVFSQYSWEIYHWYKKKLEILWHPLYIGACLNYLALNSKKIMGNPFSFNRDNAQKTFEAYIFKLLRDWWPDLSLPFHQLPEKNQENIVDLLSNLS